MPSVPKIEDYYPEGEGWIFVFGSNEAGRHGKGAALYALKRLGAIYGQAEGKQGQCYAIPTKSAHLGILPVHRIKYYVDRFIAYARLHHEERFWLTEIGCGLAGYQPRDIAPLFNGAPSNIRLPSSFRAELSISNQGTP